MAISSRLSALIVDDEISGTSALRILLNQNFESLFKTISTSSSLQDAIKKITLESFQIIFLDIQLGNKSGFDLLPYIPKHTKVIFVTAYSEHAIKAIKENAFDYLLKPLDPDELKNTIERYKSEVIEYTDNLKILTVKESGKSVPIRVNEIEFIKGHGPYSILYLTNATHYTTSRTLKTLHSLLGNKFIRIHKSYLVNKEAIKSYNKLTITTKSNQCLPITNFRSTELLALL